MKPEQELRPSERGPWGEEAFLFSTSLLEKALLETAGRHEKTEIQLNPLDGFHFNWFGLRGIQSSSSFPQIDATAVRICVGILESRLQGKESQCGRAKDSR